MRFVGWDPGKKGAIAILGDGELRIVRPPLVGTEYDPRRLFELLRTAINASPDRDLRFILEDNRSAKPARNSKGKVLSNRHSLVQGGIGIGLILGLLGALGVDVFDESAVRWVKPHDWQALQLGPQRGRAAGTTKRLAVARALALYPALESFRRGSGFPDGVADAALLADYGMRTTIEKRKGIPYPAR